VVSVEALATPIESGWVARLGAAVRREFRAEVLVPAVADPILGSPGCAVPGCVRSSRYAGLCPAHLGGGERLVVQTGTGGPRPLIQR
jgi:hypothetical protein